ncbi:MAG: UDP-N-acetylmuramate dehydrogenase [Candidatus Magasanikbacteria bacterium]
MDVLYTQLKTYGKVKLDEPMSKHTTFKIGGPAKYFVIVDDIKKLVELISWLNGEGQKYFILGGGSNLLVRDEGYDGVVIKIDIKQHTFLPDGIEAEAGAQIATLSREALDHKLAGLEWGIGLPGSIGGAVYGNAAYSGKYMADIVDKVEVIHNGEHKVLSNDDCNFANKESVFKHDVYLILKVFLKLRRIETGEEQQKAKEYILEQIKYRAKTQPKGFPSAGCVFKNCEVLVDDIPRFEPHIDSDRVLTILHNYHKIPVGYLIEKVGLRGKKLGGAQVSPEHANFIVNAGGATAQDVLTLIEEIKQKVYTTYGLELEEEVQVV